MTVPVVSMLLLSFLLFAAPSEAAFQSIYTYSMDCCPVQANVTIDALSQCGNLFNILTKGMMVYCTSNNARLFVNAGDAVLNISSNYFGPTDFQCVASGSSYNASLPAALVSNFRYGVFDHNVSLLQASSIGICDILYAGFSTFTFRKSSWTKNPHN